MRFEDNYPAVTESFGYLSTPLPDDPATGIALRALPDRGRARDRDHRRPRGRVHRGGREQLALNFAYNYLPAPVPALAHGIVDWVTRGVHLGYWRNYFTVHIDDVFNADARWSTAATARRARRSARPGRRQHPIRMTAGRRHGRVAWQQAERLHARHALQRRQRAGGRGERQRPADRRGPGRHGAFRWTNHTYTHPFLGCVQDFTCIPWRCADGRPPATYRVGDQATIDSRDHRNIAWANATGSPIRPDELVSGEHSGPQILPQQPDDNPNFVARARPRTGSSGWAWTPPGSPSSAPVGPALGVPRHPINVFYNVGTQEEEVYEYNWIYTSAADGGSGICAQPETTTCISPLDPATGSPPTSSREQVQIMLGYVLTNDPRPFYLHQSNLAEAGCLPGARRGPVGLPVDVTPRPPRWSTRP